MTLIELSIGLVLTSMVIGALGAVWFAVARTWDQSSAVQATTLTASHAVGRLELTLREAKYVLQYRRGSLGGSDPASAAQVLFWRKDVWNTKALGGQQDTNTAADSTVQAAEMALLEHDPVDRRLYLYESIPAAQMTLDQQTRAGAVVAWPELIASTTPANLKKCDFVRRRVFCEAVDGAVVNVPSWGRAGRPSLEFALKLSRQGDKSVVYGLASLRGPTRPQ
jgi:hypothetical protein